MRSRAAVRCRRSVPSARKRASRASFNNRLPKSSLLVVKQPIASPTRASGGSSAGLDAASRSRSSSRMSASASLARRSRRRHRKTHPATSKSGRRYSSPASTSRRTSWPMAAAPKVSGKVVAVEQAASIIRAWYPINCVVRSAPLPRPLDSHASIHSSAVGTRSIARRKAVGSSHGAISTSVRATRGTVAVLGFSTQSWRSDSASLPA